MLTYEDIPNLIKISRRGYVVEHCTFNRQTFQKPFGLRGPQKRIYPQKHGFLDS